MSSPEAVILSTVDLRKNYEMPTGSLEILRGVNLEVNRGEMLFVTGKSGSGKSTLLHLLGGLDRPSGGRIFYQGRDLAKASERELAKIRSRNIGYVFQFYHLLPELTVYENVLLPTLIAGKKNKDWVKEVLKRVKLWNRRTHFPSELSGGEKQRVAIARALANRPEVVLCDEPTGNLDEETAGSIMTLLFELHRNEGHTFMIVTHDEELARMGTRVLKIHEGQLVSPKPL
ncbi:MAG: Lipoprotein-releasing system ATP-binding protein LolD [Candidatus Omnitrophica bacterium ADurb.Bin292]|nr:MAG: Lipoprotein-releasing system ATP-binding protein LolD [Candidatus Omnitrophica bacterium ADurb.Bin292]HPW76451.1 ABC transporter ATP-binding protein [Candidatus Omnitrophota bacterium]